MKGLLAVIVVLVLLGAPATVQAAANVQVRCRVDREASECTFSNAGDAAGVACATVILTNPSTGYGTRSNAVCSGHLTAGATSTAAVTFPALKPEVLCRDGWSECEIHVEAEAVVPVGWTTFLPAYLSFLVVIASSIWVYFDAKRIGARGGLTKGLFNFGPTGWAGACLMFWVLCFPAYLAKRGKIRAARLAEHSLASSR